MIVSFFMNNFKSRKKKLHRIQRQSCDHCHFQRLLLLHLNPPPVLEYLEVGNKQPLY